MVIDGHAHSGGEFYAPSTTVSLLDSLGVDKVVLSPGPLNFPASWPIPDITNLLKDKRLNRIGNRLIKLAAGLVPERFSLTAGNEYVADISSKIPERVLQAYWIDPRENRVVEQLQANFRLWNFKMVKLHLPYTPCRLDSQPVIRIVKFCGQEGLPIFIHIGAEEEARIIVSLAKKNPRTSFIVGHLLGLRTFEKENVQDIQNVYFDISPPNMLPLSYVSRALKIFGARKLLLGSDTPYGIDNLKKAIERVHNLEISLEEKKMILGQNIMSILNIER